MSLRILALALALLSLHLLHANSLGAGVQPPPGDKTLIELLDEAQIVLCVKIGAVDLLDTGRVGVADVLATCAVKGDAGQKKLLVVQELFFPSDVPAFRPGREALLFLTGLPAQSRWEPYRSKGIRYMPVGRGAGVKEMEPAGLKRAVEFLGRYTELRLSSDPRGVKKYLDFLVQSLDSPDALLQEAAVAALGRLEALPSEIASADRSRLQAFLLDPDRSLSARSRLLGVLVELGGFESAISALLRNEPGMRPSILALLLARRGAVTVEPGSVMACLEDDRPQVREQALILAGEAAGDEAASALRQAALKDPSPEVRARAMSILGRGHSADQARSILIQGFSDESPYVVGAAARALVRREGADATRDLARLLYSPDPKSRTVGILMLAAQNEDEARRILRQASETLPDPEARELCGRVLKEGALQPDALDQVLGSP
ncbi:MAG: HEAT repeat domain-containing protein [bacterium]